MWIFLFHACQSFDVYHLNIYALQLFAFCFYLLLHTLYQTTFCIHHFTSYIHINNKDYHAIDLQWHQHVSWCSYVHMHILILIRIVLNILYLYIQLTITLHLQYQGQLKFQNNKTWHHIESHNSHLMSFSAHLQESSLLSFITQCLTQSLQFISSL